MSASLVTTTLPPRVSPNKALRSPELARGSGGWTRGRAGAQFCRCLPLAASSGTGFLPESCQQARAVHASQWVHWRVPAQRPGRRGLYTFVCVLVTLPAQYFRSALLARAPSIPSAQLPCPLLHGRSAPCCLSSPVPPPTRCAPARSTSTTRAPGASSPHVRPSAQLLVLNTSSNHAV